MRTLKVFLILIAIIMLLALILYLWPAMMDSPLGIAVLFPILSVYLFHAMGIPGLLEHNGACGWGWCPPTAFGWIFLVVVWGAILVGVSALIARITRY